jgi:hypothetical protein
MLWITPADDLTCYYTCWYCGAWPHRGGSCFGENVRGARRPNSAILIPAAWSG